MEYEELLEKYQALLNENERLKTENKALKAQLGIFGHQICCVNPLTTQDLASDISQNSTPVEKVRLFMSLFRGRDDVYARRWQNKEGKSGYMPVCRNEWQTGLCGKPRAKCSNCVNKSYQGLDETVIEKHLKGQIVVGIYPMLPDDTCYFLAIDFDDEDWKKDIAILRNVCRKFSIPLAVERSRSGRGAHAWFFFADRISAALARKLGTAIITYSMSQRHEITFKSYDRLFPNQDTMPRGGLGNLIALPLQMAARKDGNSVFIDDNLVPYADQWKFLGTIEKLHEDKIQALIVTLCQGNELGLLKKEDEDEHKPWETKVIKLSQSDFPRSVNLTKANMLYISKDGISQKALNVLKRLAAFKNPEYYKAQTMRLPTYNHPRVISCSEETDRYLSLPRGCETDICNLFNNFEIDANWVDQTNHGRPIRVEFTGELREEQHMALNELLKYNNGVLSATTAFGKTVIAAKLIAERKVNTLILVHRQQLLLQWMDRLATFLKIHEQLPVLPTERRRKINRGPIGQLGAGKDNLSCIIDVALMQSLYNCGEVKSCVKEYGMVIVDECHHVPAFSFERVLNEVNAKYVYGLTATPTRKDGHHPIIYMSCGPLRYRVDAKKQAEQRPFEHCVLPRFTGFRMPADKDEITIQKIYTEIVTHEIRNQFIVNDVIENYKAGRNSLVLTERTAHVEIIAKKLSEKIPDVIVLTGGMGARKSKEVLKKIAQMPQDKQLTLVATGKYIGEGFDEPRLDTLFLAMPISWKGTLQQYAGRLHRSYENKREVQIYDYVDIHVKMLETMYHRRLNGYAAIGYKVRGEAVPPGAVDIIFNTYNFLPVYFNDITNALREVVIVSPYVTKKRVLQMSQTLQAAASKRIKVIAITRPGEDYKAKDEQAVMLALDILKQAGVQVVFQPNIHQKFAVIDQRLVWYGSINLLSFGNAEESMMRLESSNIANELLSTVFSK